MWSQYLRGNETDAARLALEYLDLNRRTRRNFNYGNCIHDANQVLGLIRLHDGDVEAACDCLREAGLTPGSPQLNSFGPRMVLAAELVKVGKNLVVLEYLDNVARFWLKPSESSRAAIPDYDD